MAETKTKVKPAVKKVVASEATVKKAVITETKAKPAVKKAVASETAVKKAVTKPRAKKAEKLVSNKDRYEMIQYAAYLIAERNDFIGDPNVFWAEAEAQISNTKS
jgi:hypothetical protein